MSTFVKITSVCGASSGVVDIFDAPLNPHGIVCCDACQSIIDSRESWALEYDYDFYTGMVIA